MTESPTRWRCGCLIGAGGHQTRGEAARCYHAQPALRFPHLSDDLRVPVIGCECRACVEFRAQLANAVPRLLQDDPGDSGNV